VGKKKAVRKQARKEARPAAEAGGDVQAPGVEVEPVVEPVESADVAELRTSVGKGTLAEKTLDTIEAVITELEQAYVEVAALGKSLALAREQLVEQEAELEALKEAAKTPRTAAASRAKRPAGAARPARPRAASPSPPPK
jgi:hypothetical protein